MYKRTKLKFKLLLLFLNKLYHLVDKNMDWDWKILLTLLQAEIGWWTIGWPANGKRGFGVLNERGLNLVPAKNHTKTKKGYIFLFSLRKTLNKWFIKEKKIRNWLPLVGPPTMMTATTFSSELSISKELRSWESSEFLVPWKGKVV